MTEFIDQSAYRALAYVQAASTAQAHLTGPLLDVFNRERAPEWTSVWNRFAIGTQEAPSRSMADYLKRVGWVRAGARDVLTITALGAAVLNAHSDLETDESEFELVIRPEVPLDYGALYREISRTTDAMIVDAYFAGPSLDYVAPIEEVKRILIAETNTQVDGSWTKRKEDFRRRLKLSGTHIEIRTVPKKNSGLHDRFVLPTSGQGLMLGGSFGGQKPNTVVTLSAGTTSLHRQYYDGIWAKAVPLPPLEELDA